MPEYNAFFSSMLNRDDTKEWLLDSPKIKNCWKCTHPLTWVCFFKNSSWMAWGWVHFHQIFDIILVNCSFNHLLKWKNISKEHEMSVRQLSRKSNHWSVLIPNYSKELYISLIGTEMAWRESSALPELQLAVCVLSLALVPHHLDVGLSLSVTWKFECLCSDGLHLVLWAVFLWWWWRRRRLILFTTVWIIQFDQSHVLQGKRIWLS